MRSLWRILALQWLGGQGSEALAEDSAVLETLLSLGERVQRSPAFDVRRAPGVSHRVMMAQVAEGRQDPEIATRELWRGESRFRASYRRNG
jgi:hypothetical protein